MVSIDFRLSLDIKKDSIAIFNHKYFFYFYFRSCPRVNNGFCLTIPYPPRIDGRRGRGRPTRRWEQDINDWMDMTTTQTGRLAEDRILFRQKVQEANLAKR